MTDLRILAAGLLHVMLSSSVTHNNLQNNNSKTTVLTSEGRIRRIRGKHLLISLGSRGVLWCGSKSVLTASKSSPDDKSRDIIAIDDDIACLHIDAHPLPSNMTSLHTSGAGDAFCAGFISALFDDDSTATSSGPTMSCVDKGLSAAYHHIIKSSSIA